MELLLYQQQLRQLAQFLEAPAAVVQAGSGGGRIAPAVQQRRGQRVGARADRCT